MSAALLPALTHLSATATAALVSAIWQGTLLAVLVMLTVRLFPRLSAAARSVIWLNVFVLVALLHFVPLAVHPAAVSDGHAFHVDPRWSLAVAGAWLLLSTGRGTMLIVGALHLRRLARRAVPVAAEGVADLLRTPRGRAVRLCASEEVARPSVLGFFRPRILVPPVLLEALSPAELRHVVLHEMEHLRRHDDWTNLLQKLGLVLFPLNPALAWVERQLCAERELACDDRVMSTGARKAYALCLTHLAEHSMLRRGYALVLGAWERRPELVKRVHRILSKPVGTMGRTPALAVTGSLVAGALGCTLMLAHAPQIVSFAPAATQARMIAPINPRDLGLDGSAVLTRASMPVHRNAIPAHMAPAKDAARQIARPHTPAARLAQLRTPPPPDATLLVMAELNDTDPPQVFLALERAPSPRVVSAARGPHTRRQPAVVATYAIITPNGWLILQI